MLSKDPWVVTFDNFVQDSEIQAIFNTSEGKYDISTDTGARDASGETGKIKSSGRTSTNAWCIGACNDHPEVQKLTKRIEEVTDMDEGQFENIQVLRYEPGQYYRTHHDASNTQRLSPAGMRILTLFLYFSDVEEGGETNFPLLKDLPASTAAGLSVTPKKGRALLWPSVLSDDPMEVDSRTSHQALPVKKGLKFAGNVWVHMHNYKIPNHWGCTGSFG